MTPLRQQMVDAMVVRARLSDASAGRLGDYVVSSESA